MSTVTESAELAQQVKIPTEVLRNIASFADAVAIAVETQGADISEVLGDGFTVATNEDKGRLCGLRFIILDWSIVDSDKYVNDNGEVGKFATMRIVTEHNDKFIVNDGGTGILAQLMELDSMGMHRPQNVSKGLRKSEYTYTDEKGKRTPAVTYYLDTSAAR